ncbi:leucine rich repeat-containing, partial [Cystoisospora suis]
MKALLQCLSGIERLDVRLKVAFRVLSRIADVMEGHPDLQDAREETLTLSLLCKRESQMWNDQTIRNDRLYLDDQEREDRAVQQSEFVRLCLLERLLLFLMPLANASVNARFARQKREKKDSEYWAGRLKGDAEDMEDDISRRAEEAEALAAAAASAAGNKTPETANVTPKIFAARRARDRLKKSTDSPKDNDEDEIEDPALENLKGEDSEPVKGRERLMEALMNADLSVDPEIAAAYLHGGAQLYGMEGLWLNLAKGEMNVPYIVAAFLRCIYTCLHSATSPVIVSDTISTLRRVTVLRKLV